MRTYLAIDGGGTKTEAVRVNEEGHILAHARAGSSNPNDVGRDGAAACLTALLDRLGADGRDAAIFAGISGAIGNEAALLAALSARAKKAAVGSDAVNLLSSMGKRDGACLIAGTGSVCFARRGEDIARIGGWGYLLDEGGSGYDIGRDGLRAVLHAHDRRAEATSLTERMAQALGEPVPAAIPRIYREGKPFIAALAPVVFAAAEAGDTVAAAILDRNAACLAELIAAAVDWFGETETDPIPILLGGSILTANPAIPARLAARVPPTVVLRPGEAPPVWGAVCEAMAMDGAAPSVDAMARFLADFPA